MCLASCASSGSADKPLVAPGDNSAMTKDRLKAIRAVGEELTAAQGTGADLSVERESLKKAIWARSSVDAVRLAALEALMLDTSGFADTQKMLSLLIPTESASREWEMLTEIGDIAAAHGWTDLAPAFVVSWSRPVGSPTDDKRPERIALEKLFPNQPVEDVVFDVFAHRGVGASTALDERQELAAWSLLRRIDRGRTTELVKSLEASGPNASPLVQALGKAARDLDMVPETGQQLEWVQRLTQPQHAAFWSTAAGAIANLTPDQRKGLALRHLGALVWSARQSPERLALSPEAAIDSIGIRLKGQTAYRRASGNTSRYDETMRSAKKLMVWGDALSVMAAMDAMDQNAVIGAFFTQADTDRGDTSTEYGGAIDGLTDGAMVARLFPPRPTERLGDRQFVASHDLIAASDESIFHYHFHAAAAANTDYAGPSEADIKYATEYGRSCLVVTTLTADRINIDWYCGTSAVLDLGAVDRPTTSDR